MITNTVYRWEYYHTGPVIYCQDSSGGDDKAQAMCASEETAKVFCKILNANREPENVL